MASTVSRAMEALRRGRFALVYDGEGREEETDLAIASEFVTPDAVRVLRKDAGGWICTVVPPDAREKLGLPFLADVLRASSSAYPILKDLVPATLPYDSRSAFSITVSHRDTYTGVTDADRARTIARFAEITREALRQENGWAQRAFAQEFRAPGHVALLNPAPGLLAERRGHTELCTALLLMAGLTPSATVCEMLGDDGRALTKADAKRYAQARNLVFLEGREILEAWRAWSA
ncbi:MAG: 3,4-dihydroxy-2-butanone-4-phosphate synthase [Euryarchaeota archaeon]|nr:3,4-dihydroxy-2-butanone-4-phosphate synthase [Euryarchaeota archaeon]